MKEYIAFNQTYVQRMVVEMVHVQILVNKGATKKVEAVYQSYQRFVVALER
jgi:hypothetical protein